MAKLNMMEFRSDILKIMANDRVKWVDMQWMLSIITFCSVLRTCRLRAKISAEGPQQHQKYPHKIVIVRHPFGRQIADRGH
jgi:hypothetical protein